MGEEPATRGGARQGLPAAPVLYNAKSSMSSPPFQLRALGFCGADDSVPPGLLQVLSSDCPKIEWGVLFRPDKEATPRYASMAWVHELARINKESSSAMKLAAHLCGSRCQEVLEGDFQFVQNLSQLGFGRVQINATAANNVQVAQDRLTDYAENLRSCMFGVPTVEWIFQLNDETRGIWNALCTQELPLNVNVLFDASCGLGVLATEYPAPLSTPREVPSGYAGGIGPDNISNVLRSVAHAAQGKPVWIDMESSLRENASDKMFPVPRDVFSIRKCFDCVLALRAFESS